MKLTKYILSLAAISLLLTACNDDDPVLGNPVIEYPDAATQAHFGDSLAFTVKASDVEVPLSTLKAQLYFGEEMVEETVIRTKESGKDYTGKIYVPYFANVPDGTATLKLVLQNINFTITEQEYPVAITHPQFPYLTLQTDEQDRENGPVSYRMEPKGDNLYAYTGKLPQKIKGKIIAPKVGENGNELVFGYVNNSVSIGAESGIPFSNSKAGKYTISLNTYTFEVSPLVSLKLNGIELEAVDDSSSKVDLSLLKGQSITVEGFPNFEDWWIDTDFFAKNDDGTLSFKAKSGDYRIIADTKLQYFRVEVLKNGSPASLENDGTGALWVIGADFGKPSVSANETGWNTDKAVCMAPIADKVYQMTLVGGKTVKTGSTNFKFYGAAMDWGNEFKHDRLTSSSNIILVGDGTGGHDDGNLYLAEGVKLQDNVIYVFTVDMTAGVDKAVLSVTENGELPFEEKRLFFNGVKMTTNDNSIYTIKTSLSQGCAIEFNTLDGLSEYYVDPDFFNFDADSETISFIPVNGDYEVTVNKTAKTICAQRMSGGNPATLSNDGHGAIYIMGWGCGNPSLDSQFGWETSKAFGMAEVSPKVYRFTAVAGPEKGSYNGQRIRLDYIDVKLFWQKDWGGEFSKDKNLTMTAGTEKLLKISDSGNIGLADGVKLEEDATYIITVDLSEGNDKGTISLTKK